MKITFVSIILAVIHSHFFRQEPRIKNLRLLLSLSFFKLSIERSDRISTISILLPLSTVKISWARRYQNSNLKTFNSWISSQNYTYIWFKNKVSNQREHSLSRTSKKLVRIARRGNFSPLLLLYFFLFSLVSVCTTFSRFSIVRRFSYLYEGQWMFCFFSKSR